MSASRLKPYLPALVALGLAAIFASRSIGNQTWVVAPWVALLSMTLFVRTMPIAIGLPMGAAVWMLASIVGWQGVLPFQGVMAWAVPALVGLFGFLPFVADRVMVGRLPAAIGWMILPLSWVTMEAGFSLAGVGSWGALAYSQVGFIGLTQGMAVLGQAWPALMIASFASLTCSVIKGGRSARRPFLIYSLVLGLSVSAGTWRVLSPQAGQQVAVGAVVVDNLEVFRTTWGPLSYGRVLEAEALEAVRPQARALFNRLMAETQEAIAMGAQMVVWSEGNALVPASDEAEFSRQVQALAAREGVWLFVTMAVMKPGEALAENVLLVVNHQGRVVDRYLKSHPTPGEASTKGDSQMGWAMTPWGRVAWAICYDFDYPALVAQAGRRGVDLLIDPSWDSPGMTPMHSRMASLRAIENGASLIRPVNDGLNLAVDYRGKELAAFKLKAGEEAVWVQSMPVERRAVAYPWLSSWIGPLAGLLLALLGLLSLRPSTSSAA